MKPYVFDIETSGRYDAAAFLPDVEAPGNYKDAAKIAAYVEEKRAAQLERAALSAETARILCVGLLREDREDWSISVLDDDDETVLLNRTWKAFGTFKDDEIFVGFNCARFDWPMLIRRSYALGVKIPDWVPLDGRFSASRYCDLLQLWQAGDRTESISLDRLSRLCGLPGKTGNGADFGRLWREDREAALKYLELDLTLTRDLWRRMKP